MNKSTKAATGSAPVAERRPATKTIHGVTLVDDYAWLRADNWRDILRDPASTPPDIKTYLDAENDYADAKLAASAKVRKALAREMRGRIQEDESDPPKPDGKWEYYERYREGGENELVCRRRRARERQGVL